MQKLSSFNIHSLSVKTSLCLFMILSVVVGLSLYKNFSAIAVKHRTAHILNKSLPIAINSLELLDEVTDLNIALTGYIYGNHMNKSEFFEDALEFKQFRAKIPTGLDFKDELEQIDHYFSNILKVAKEDIFDAYSPINQNNMKMKIKNITEEVIPAVNTLINELLEHEKNDVHITFKNQNHKNQEHLKQSLLDDIRGVSDYSQLLNILATMQHTLDQKVLGQDTPGKSFFAAALDAEALMIEIKGHEIKPFETIRLNEINRLLQRFKKEGAEIFKILNSSKQQHAIKTLKWLQEHDLKELGRVLDRVSETYTQSVSNEVLSLNENVQLYKYYINTASIIGIIIVFSALFYVKHFVIDSISHIHQMILKLRDRDNSLKIKKSTRKDEIGQITDSLLAFQTELRELATLRQSQIEGAQQLHLIELQDANNDLKIREERLKTQAIKIKEMNQELEQFVRITSHDLRAPMKNILGFISMIEMEVQDKGSQVLQSTIEKIKSSTLRLCNLVDDLRNLTKLNKEALNLETNSFDKIFKSVMQEHQDAILEKQVYFSVGDLPHISCYPNFIWQLFDNLTRNALTYGSDQTLINVYCEKSDDETVLKFSNTCDQNISETEELFLPFKQGKGANPEGTGIGLTIAKKIVELHNGTIWIETIDNLFTVCMTFEEN